MADKAKTTTKSEATSPSLQIGSVSEWPGAFGAYKFSATAVKLNLATILIFIAIYLAGNIMQSILPNTLEVIWQILWTAASFVLSVTAIIIYLDSAKGKKIEIEESIRRSLDISIILNMFILSVITGMLIFFGFLLFIIPGIIILPRLILAPYYLVDQKLDCIEAFKASWNGTKGHSAKIWGVIGAGIVMFLPVFTLIGIPVSIYLLVMYSAISAVLYLYIQKTGPLKA